MIFLPLKLFFPATGISDSCVRTISRLIGEAGSGNSSVTGLAGFCAAVFTATGSGKISAGSDAWVPDGAPFIPKI